MYIGQFVWVITHGILKSDCVAHKESWVEISRWNKRPLLWNKYYEIAIATEINRMHLNKVFQNAKVYLDYNSIAPLIHKLIAIIILFTIIYLNYPRHLYRVIYLYPLVSRLYSHNHSLATVYWQWKIYNNNSFFPIFMFAQIEYKT